MWFKASFEYNYENIINNELEYKIIEHCILTYNFNNNKNNFYYLFLINFKT